jgi:hypothetical protein
MIRNLFQKTVQGKKGKGDKLLKAWVDDDFSDKSLEDIYTIMHHTDDSKKTRTYIQKIIGENPPADDAAILAVELDAADSLVPQPLQLAVEPDAADSLVQQPLQVVDAPQKDVQNKDPSFRDTGSVGSGSEKITWKPLPPLPEGPPQRTQS